MAGIQSDGYERTRQHWDRVFSGAQAVPAPDKPLAIPQLDAALQFAARGSQQVLDFGCGWGTIVFRLAALGVRMVHGVDVSEAAIHAAKKRSSALALASRCSFSVGGVPDLRRFSDGAFDAIVLSNVLDNLFPQDGEALVTECHRLLAPKGKLLLKLNAELSPQELAAEGCVPLDDDVFETASGTLLWNLSTKNVEALLQGRFNTYASSQVRIASEGTNRLFLLNRVP